MTDIWDRRLDRAERHPFLSLFYWAAGITLVVLAITAIVGLATTGSVFFQAAAAKKTVGARTDIKVYTPENKIAQISFFHDTCQRVNALIVTVQNNQARYNADLRTAELSKDPVRQQQATDALTSDNSDVTGAKNALANAVADYNSRSRQSTANVFKGSGLPDQITLPNPLPAGLTINCG